MFRTRSLGCLNIMAAYRLSRRRLKPNLLPNVPEIGWEHLVTRCQPAIPDRKTRRGVAKRRMINAERKQKILLFFNCFEFSMKRDQKMCFGSPYPLDCTVPWATSVQIVFARRRQTFGSPFRLRFRSRLHQPRWKISRKVTPGPATKERKELNERKLRSVFNVPIKPSCVNAILISSNSFF